MILELTEEERAILQDLVAMEVTDLPSEIRRTNDYVFRDELKHREQLLRELQARLKKEVHA